MLASATAQHALIKLRVASRSDHKKVGSDLGGEAHDIAHGVPGHDMSLQGDVTFLGQRRAAVPISSLISSMYSGR